MASNPGQDPYGYPKLDLKAARALNPRTQTIRIESILGGHSTFTHLAKSDQFESSIGIDPFDSIIEGSGGNVPSRTYLPSSGLLRPSSFNTAAGVTTTARPNWIKGEPKTGLVFAYDTGGSVYTTTGLASAFTALSDKGLTDSGAGLEYYDNYMYLATGTDIVRYGPLNGSPSFTGAYWTGTLSKAALTNTTYPTSSGTLPNHFLHRHSDGKLYIADVVGNQGTIHFISTTKTSVEGDTDNGSTFSKLTFGYGLWPTAIESYGSSIVVALYEGSTNGQNGGSQRAKLAFWDTTSQNFNSITWVEFPDEFISGIKNIDGTLFITSSRPNQIGFKVSQYVGGSSFKTVTEVASGSIPFPGGLDGDAGRLFIATSIFHPTVTTNSFVGILQINTSGPRGISVFNIGNVISSSIAVPALLLASKNQLSYRKTIYLGCITGGAGVTGALTASHDDTEVPDYSIYTRRWLSQRYIIGQPFKITKIRIPFAQAIAANMSVTPYLIFDEVTSTKTLATIDNTNYSGKLNVVLRPDSATGQHNFQLELQWTGSALCVVNLPITIEYELIPD